jgi:hypothetical protein
MMIVETTISTAMIRKLSLFANDLFFMGIGFYLSQQVQI